MSHFSLNSLIHLFVVLSFCSFHTLVRAESQNADQSRGHTSSLRGEFEPFPLVGGVYSYAISAEGLYVGLYNVTTGKWASGQGRFVTPGATRLETLGQSAPQVVTAGIEGLSPEMAYWNSPFEMARRGYLVRYTGSGFSYSDPRAEIAVSQSSASAVSVGGTASASATASASVVVTSPGNAGGWVWVSPQQEAERNYYIQHMSNTLNRLGSPGSVNVAPPTGHWESAEERARTHAILEHMNRTLDRLGVPR